MLWFQCSNDTEDIEWKPAYEENTGDCYYNLVRPTPSFVQIPMLRGGSTPKSIYDGEVDAYLKNMVCKFNIFLNINIDISNINFQFSNIN